MFFFVLNSQTIYNYKEMTKIKLLFSKMILK